MRPLGGRYRLEEPVGHGGMAAAVDAQVYVPPVLLPRQAEPAPDSVLTAPTAAYAAES